MIKRISYDTDVIRNALGRNDFYKTGFCKYVLLRLELIAAEHDTLREFNARSVEHVLPQTPNTDSYWDKYHDLNNISEYVDKVGNLVLLSKSKNSSASNYDFIVKKDRYLRPRVSDYPRSIQVLGYSDWTRETIEERTVQAQEMILENP